jgi:hypothetical protein
MEVAFSESKSVKPPDLTFKGAQNEGFCWLNPHSIKNDACEIVNHAMLEGTQFFWQIHSILQ